MSLPPPSEVLEAERPRLTITGGTGRLGTALLGPGGRRSTLLAAYGLDAPSSAMLDVTDPQAVTAYVERVRPRVILHAAAYTDVAAAETSRERAWTVNVVGTRNVASAAEAVGATLVHVSTDYVFWGGNDRPAGGYRETDPVGPVRNHYALTKLVAEEAARRASDLLIVRTSFRPSTWEHPAAFDDVYTSQDYVDVIADAFVVLLTHLLPSQAGTDDVLRGVVHLATERKSVYDLAVRRNPHVRRGSKRDAGVQLPDDVSLDVNRWNAWVAATSSRKGGR